MRTKDIQVGGDYAIRSNKGHRPVRGTVKKKGVSYLGRNMGVVVEIHPAEAHGLSASASPRYIVPSCRVLHTWGEEMEREKRFQEKWEEGERHRKRMAPLAKALEAKLQRTGIPVSCGMGSGSGNVHIILSEEEHIKRLIRCLKVAEIDEEAQ